MNSKKITYREIKEKQKADLNAMVMNRNIYRQMCTPFTYIFLRLGIEPNTITISSLLLCFLGFYFLSKGSYGFMLLGFLCFLLFRTIDMSDGEVARWQNATSKEGVYFDRVSHYIFALCFGIGLSIGLSRLYGNDIFLFLGFVFTFGFTVENAIIDSTKYLLREGLIRASGKEIKKLKMKEFDKEIWKKLMARIYKGRSWNNSSLFAKIFGIMPFQGLVFMDYYVPPIFTLLTIIEFFLIKYTSFSALYGIFGLITSYSVLVSVSKIIWIIHFSYKIEKSRSITSTLN